MDQGFIAGGFAAFFAANHLDEVVGGNDVAGFTADDVSEAGERAAFVTQLFIIGDGVRDAPAGESVHGDVELVASRHFGVRTIPFEDAFFDTVDLLDEGFLEMQAGLVFRGVRIDGGTHGFSELGDEHLFGLVHGIGAAGEDDDGDGQRNESDDGFHGKWGVRRVICRGS